MTLKTVLERHYGVKTDIRINPLVSAVPTSVVQLLKPDPNRLAWTLINLGANHLFVGFAPDVASDKGVYVSATGGVFGLLFLEDFDLCAFPVYAIADTAECDIYLVEVVEV